MSRETPRETVKKTRPLFRAFCVYVRRIVEYCSSVWNPAYKCDILKIEAVQRRFTKRLNGYHSLTYKDRLVKLGAESLQLRRLKIDLAMMYRSLFGCVAIEYDNLFNQAARSHNTGGQELKIEKEHCYVNCRANSFACHAVNAWKALPGDIFTCC